MALIKKIQLLQIAVYGFKGFELQQTFNFEPTGKNIIIGDNGKGKSSIGEAIAWCISGKNIRGDARELQLVNNKAKTASVSISFLDEKGKTHILCRKMNSAVTVKFDDKQITQEKLREIIDMDLFLAIFNPLYYLALDTNSAKKTVFSLMPPFSRADIFTNMSPVEQGILAGESFDEGDTNSYLKAQRKAQKELEERRLFVEGGIESLKVPIIIPEAMTFDDTLISAVEKQLEELALRKPVLKNLSESLIQKADLEKKALSIKELGTDTKRKLAELKGKLALLEQSLRTEETSEYRQTCNTEAIEVKVNSLRADYRRIAEENNALSKEKKELVNKKVDLKEGDICPHCKQYVTAQSVKNLNKELAKEVADDVAKIEKKQEAKKATLAELEQEGKTLLEQISKAKKADDDARAAFELKKTKTIATLKSEIAQLQKQIEELQSVDEAFESTKVAQLSAIDEEIKALGLDELEAQNKKIQEDFDADVMSIKKPLQEQLAKLRAEKEAVIANEANRANLLKRAETAKQQLEAKEKELKDIADQEALIAKKIAAMKSYNVQKTNLVNKIISKYLTNVSLKLEKIVESTGEVKDTFDILYMGKDVKICSTSERIRAGLEISKMISELSGYDFPVFVDNGESITDYSEASTQTIEVRVVKGVNLSQLKKDGTAVEVPVAPVPKGRMKKEAA